MRRRTAGALGTAVTLVLLAGGCGDDADEELPSDTRAPIVEEVEPTDGPTTTLVRLGNVDTVTGVRVGFETIGEFEEPIDLVFRPGVTDRAYLAERAGVVRDLDLATGESTAVLDITDETTTDSERGLLGLVVAPDGGHLYVSSTNLDGDSRVVEYAIADDGALDETSARTVLALDQPFPNHNGGHLVFGPDGLLYIGLGDGGAAGDPLEAGQDRGQLLGSILRIDPAGIDGSAYAIPADNPFVGEEGARPEVWLKGVRNPWRFSFDRATGDLWVGDVGQDEIEEIDHLPADADGLNAGRGLNLGWNAMEGDQPYDDGVEPEDHTPPVFTYTHAEGGCSVTGGFVYRGSTIPELFGAYLYADYCAGDLRALAVTDGAVVDDATIADPVDGPVSFAQGPGNELYLLAQSGPLLEIVPQ
ncbi:MAG TPA: PQQ-dependent sugar dehydrogenase [Acidimicrobiales bacterium]|jgi:glucose/arabinose dehydrogenase